MERGVEAAQLRLYMYMSVSAVVLSALLQSSICRQPYLCAVSVVFSVSLCISVFYPLRSSQGLAESRSFAELWRE